MLKLIGSSSGPRFCDGHSRRSFLQIGGLAMGGLSLPQLLAAEQSSPKTNDRLGHKAIIMIYMPGGPPHQDMYDLKMEAPREIRGEFSPIKTKVPGIEVCELLPKLAANMDRLIPIRSIVGAKDRHESFQCLTGRLNERQPAGRWPEMGSALSDTQGSTSPGMPPFVALSPRMQHRPYNNGKPGFLGGAHAPFKPMDEGKDDLKLNGISVEQFADRGKLLRDFDQFRRDVDSSKTMEGLDAFTQQAYGILTSSQLSTALDLDKENPKVRERYGKGTGKHQGDGAPRLNEQFLLARRLVEAGVRCVTLSYSFWDWHGSNFKHARNNLPDFDRAMASLVEDLHDRGLNEDVTVIAWGEFGRTPRINKNAGRDHWPRVSSALLAGGGMRTGQVIGSTTRDGGEADDRPVHFQEIFATLYNNLSIDTDTATITDLQGRPHYIVDKGYKPLPEVA